MTLIDFRPRWPVGFRLSCSMSIALSPVVDVLSGVPMAMRSPCRHAHSASASTLHSRVHSPVQTACPERAMPAAWWAFAGRQAAPCVAPPGQRIPVLSGREKMQGKIKGRSTTLREKPVCTWGWRGTHLIAAPCRVVSQCLDSIELRACFTRSATLGLDGSAI